MMNPDHLLRVRRFALLFGFWLVLTGGQVGGLPFGVAAAAGGVLLGEKLAPPAYFRMRLLRLVGLAPGFLYRSLVGGVDVARRAFHPRLPIRPGWISYQPHIPQGAARVVLSGEVTMMPGSLVAGSDGSRLLVHCLDTDMPVADMIRAEEERLEKAVAR